MANPVPEFIFDLVNGPILTIISGSVTASIYMTDHGTLGFGAQTSSSVDTASISLLAKTASYAVLALTAATASYIDPAVLPPTTSASYAATASLARSASYVNWTQVGAPPFATSAGSSVSASYSDTASYVKTALTASFIPSTAINWSLGQGQWQMGGNPPTASYALQSSTASYLLGSISSAVSASYATTASYASRIANATYTGSKIDTLNVNYLSSSLISSTAAKTTIGLGVSSSGFGYLPDFSQSFITEFYSNNIAWGDSSSIHLFPLDAKGTGYDDGLVITCENYPPYGDCYVFTSNWRSIFINGTSANAVFATNAWSSSYASVATIAQTASFVSTASLSLRSTTASLALTASYFNGTVSNATTASFASTASYFSGAVTNATSASFASTASYFSGIVTNSTSSSFASTSSYVKFSNVDDVATDVFAGTSSYSMMAQTASYIAWANVDEKVTDQFVGTSSFSLTASKVAINAGTPAGVIVVDHFMGTTNVGNSAWTVVVSGTGAAVTAITGSVGHPGCVRVETGTTATGRATLTQNTASIFLGGNVSYYAEAVCMLVPPAIGLSATQNGVLRVGLGNNTAAGDITDGVYLEAQLSSSSPVWTLKTANNGTRTITTTAGTVPLNSWVELGIAVFNTSSANFYVNNSLIGSITTNIPSARTTGGPFVKMETTVGTSSKAVIVDALSLTFI